MLKHHFDFSGKNETIVLIHGFCENSGLFDKQVDYLKSNFNILTLDLPGFGASKFIKNITIPTMASKVKELLDYLEIKNCFMFGHSMGGYVTLAFAKQFSYMLIGFGLIHSTAAKDSFERLAKRTQLIKFIQKNGTSPFLKTFFPELFFDKEVNKEAINQLIENAESTPLLGVVEGIKAMMLREENFSLLEKTELPVFFAIGKYDTIITDNEMFAQAALCNKSQICYLQNSNHMGMVEECTQLNLSIEHFVKINAKSIH
jgi:pimeloyl-ACP methyl ester carboxylesterase